MKQNPLFQMRTLFDPTSVDWANTNLAEKCALMEKCFPSGRYRNLRSGSLLIFCSAARGMFPRKAEGMSDEEYEKHSERVDRENPPIPNEILTISIGLYLSRSLDPSFAFPIRPDEVQAIINDLALLKDKRRRRTKSLRSLLNQNFGGNTREFFDHPSYEGEQSDMATKRERLKIVLDQGYSALEVLYLHLLDYRSMGAGYVHVVSAAPESAFALLWDTGKLMIKN
jgi:hypothetical protein